MLLKERRYDAECEFNANPGEILKIKSIKKDKDNVYYLKVEME